MKAKPARVIAATILLTGLLTACDVTVHQPGVYKGKKDPLATQDAAEQRAGALSNRAARAFGDRGAD